MSSIGKLSWATAALVLTVSARAATSATLNAQVDDRLKAVADSKTEVARLQNKAEQERVAWQAAVKHYNSVRGTGGSKQ